MGLLSALLITGVSFTLYLPAYEPGNPVTDNRPTYHIEQPTLKKPLLMSDTLLDAFEQNTNGYGLTLGLFGQLQQAIDQGIKYGLKDNPTIVKATDRQRYWYILILGPYMSQAQANQRRLLLQQNMDISTTLIKWPLADEEIAKQIEDNKKAADKKTKGG